MPDHRTYPVRMIEGPRYSGRTEMAIRVAVEMARRELVAFYSDVITPQEFETRALKYIPALDSIRLVQETQRDILNEHPLLDTPQANAFVFDMPEQVTNAEFLKFVMRKIAKGYPVVFVSNDHGAVRNAAIALYQKVNLKLVPTIGSKECRLLPL